MKISFNSTSAQETEAVVVFVTKKDDIPVFGTFGTSLNEETDGIIFRTVENDASIADKNGMVTIVSAPNINTPYILLVGLGEIEKLSALDAEALGGKIQKKLNALKISNAAVMVEGIESDRKAEDIANEMAFGAVLGGYRFEKFNTKIDDDKKQTLCWLDFVLDNANLAQELFDTSEKVAEGVFWTRNLTTRPGNDLYPEVFADEIKKELTKLNVHVQILDVKEMEKLGMGALLSVGQGSANDAKLVIMEYIGDPEAKDKTPISFVGKGITFDTGGISLKPGAGMWDMKFDMGGAGVVVGLMRVLAKRKAKVNVVAAVALAENMPSSRATRPGDIVTSLSGQTVEVLNTDAEGRLVLADALWHIQEMFSPKLIVDLATLTGAVIVALGHEYGGIYSNNDTLPKQIIEAGVSVGEKAWHMPMCDMWEKAVVSDVADIKNITAPNVGAGSATAASFLKRFIKDETVWAHIDIAGVAWKTTETATVPKGATAWGVRLLDRFVADNYEQK